MFFRCLFLSVLTAILIACGQTNVDPKTPEGAHYLFTRSLADRDYPTTYGLIASSSRADFRNYLATTRDVVTTIRSRYPLSLQQAAIDHLSIPLGHGPFSYAEIDAHTDEKEVFTVLCQRMFGDSSGTFSLAREFAARADEIRQESEDSVTVVTLAGEQLTYVRESDGIWRTKEVFGKNFDHLLRVSRSNLEITLNNADLYSQ